MRELIEKLTDRYISEAILDLDKDVNRIYKEIGMDDLFKAIKSRDADRIKNAFSKYKVDRTIWSSDTSMLKSKVGKEAHRINPVKMAAGVFSDGSYYSPLQGKIQFSLSKQPYGLLKQLDYDADSIDAVLKFQKIRFWKEFTEESFKGTIYHELTHWADDTLHGGFIAKKMKKASEGGGVSSVIGKYGRIGHSPLEMNAQISAIKVLRNSLGKKDFDKLTWVELFQHKSSLAQNFQGFRNEKDYEMVMKKFLRRLDREGLLGKSLRKYPSYSVMKRMLGLV